MKILELFAGTRSIGKAFEKHGHEVFSVEWNKDFENIDLYADIGQITAEDILERFGHPDVIWASPDCTSYSIAGITHHRRKNPETGVLEPVSDYAKFCDVVNQHVLELIEELHPQYWFIENPRRHEKDAMDARVAKIHSDLLPVRRHKDETNRHLD